MNKTAPKALMPIIAVDSVDEARTFYVDTLGFEHSMGVVGKDGQFDFVTVNREGARVMFSRKPEPGKPSGARQPVELYLEVDDVDGYHDELKKRKVRITDPLTTQWWGDRTFKVLDPNGYEIWFYETTGEPKPPEGTKIV
jgi:uncharacterized glyoxalase superfamily protein PhnB